MRRIANRYLAALRRRQGDVHWRCSSGAAHPHIKATLVPLPHTRSCAGIAPELPVCARQQPWVLAPAPVPPSPIPLRPAGHGPSLSPSHCLCLLQLCQLIKNPGFVS